MPSSQIYTLDLKFRGLSGGIAAYLIPHRHGALLVECGPGSTQETLTAELEKHELKPGDISDVLLTHIHLDHAGAAGGSSPAGRTPRPATRPGSPPLPALRSPARSTRLISRAHGRHLVHEAGSVSAEFLDGGQQAVRAESGNRRREAVIINYKLPFLRPHYGGHMTGCYQCVKAGRSGLQQHRNRGPGQPAR